MTSKQKNLIRLFNSLSALGFTYDESAALRRISLTLSSWAEAECNGEIERNETTGKPERVSRAYINGMTSKRHAWPVADREAGAMRRLTAIMAPHKRRLLAYHQGDPRGCALYIVRRKSLRTTENQIALKARSHGFVCGNPDAEKQKAFEYLKSRKLTIPAKFTLPTDQYYTRGVAVCA